jgi:predicted MPP superfamily phosphohydrolase
MPVMTRRMFLMGGVSIFPYLYLERLSIAVRRYRVRIAELPPAFEGFTILQLSDLHGKEFGSGGKELLELLSRERFDLVALTGDMVVGDQPVLTPILDLLDGVGRIGNAPVYSVPGNHEWRLERAAELNGKLQQAGARVLTNSCSAIERGEQRLWVVGVDDPVTRHARLAPALSAVQDRSPRLLLAHSPHPYRQAVEHGIDLMLAGHTHGGQVRIPFLGAGYVPAMGFFPRHDYGLFSSGPTTMIVSGGLGESGIPVRFNIRPEVSLITLSSLYSPD